MGGSASRRIDVKSDGSNQGTTVTVRLPLLTKLPNADASTSQLREQTTLPNPETLRVLIVDDHEDAAQGLARLLERRACRVRLAGSGPDGLEAARAFQPDVFLLDLGLPGFDGYELVRRLRADPAFANGHFIAISGYALSGDRDRCLSAGFDEHFSKPLNFKHLLESIRIRARS